MQKILIISCLVCIFSKNKAESATVTSKKSAQETVQESDSSRTTSKLQNFLTSEFVTQCNPSSNEDFSDHLSCPAFLLVSAFLKNSLPQNVTINENALVSIKDQQNDSKLATQFCSELKNFSEVNNKTYFNDNGTLEVLVNDCKLMCLEDKTVKIKPICVWILRGLEIIVNNSLQGVSKSGGTEPQKLNNLDTSAEAKESHAGKPIITAAKNRLSAAPQHNSTTSSAAPMALDSIVKQSPDDPDVAEPLPASILKPTKPSPATDYVKSILNAEGKNLNSPLAESSSQRDQSANVRNEANTVASEKVKPGDLDGNGSAEEDTDEEDEFDQQDPEMDSKVNQLKQTPETPNSYIRHQQENVDGAPFFEDTGSNFFSFFLFSMFGCLILYVVYHNKSKIFALVLEGRRSQTRGSGGGSSRRKHTAAYRKLDSNLEEAINSSGGGRHTSQIIY